MYFLGGDRIYIKPAHACGTINEQIEDCLLQVRKINSGKKIFKLNFFVDTESDEDYAALVKRVDERVNDLFTEQFIENFIAQPPLTCKIIVEAFYYDPSVWQIEFIEVQDNKAAIFKSNNTRFLLGMVQSNHNPLCAENSTNAFTDLNRMLELAGMEMKNIVRQWNYIENILGFDGEAQRYQEFNNIRSSYYKDAFRENGFPAATGIGMNRGGVIIEFVASVSQDMISRPVDNPGQISAHKYSEEVLVGEECVLKTTPKFERARYLETQDNKLIFISGTASIIGENTIGVGDPVKQTEVTIDNIQRLYSEEVLATLPNPNLKPRYGHARIYVKNKRDFAAIKRTFKQHFGNLPVVYIIGDICRDDLLVEIEGKVILA